MPFVLLHGAWLAGEADPPPNTRVGGPIPAQVAVLLTSEEPSNEATTQRAHTVIPRGGSAYKPKGYSSHPPNPLSILLFSIETTVIFAPFCMSRGQRQ